MGIIGYHVSNNGRVMDANIYKENGTLIVEFRKPIQHNSMYRDVIIESNDGGDKIVVRGNYANFTFEMGLWGDEFDFYSEENMNEVLPEYIEEYDTPVLSFWERPIGKEGKKWKTSRRVKRIKPGWFEYKNTNISREFVTTKYIIYK